LLFHPFRILVTLGPGKEEVQSKKRGVLSIHETVPILVVLSGRTEILGGYVKED